VALNARMIAEKNEMNGRIRWGEDLQDCKCAYGKTHSRTNRLAEFRDTIRAIAER
jgi:hypothetical protein